MRYSHYACFAMRCATPESFISCYNIGGLLAVMSPHCVTQLFTGNKLLQEIKARENQEVLFETLLN